MVTYPCGALRFEAGFSLAVELPHWKSPCLRAAIVDRHLTAGQVMGADYVMSFHRLLGDFDGDARVDGSDFALFRTAIGSQITLFDLNGDGQVNAVDFVQFRMTFGTWI